MSMQGPTKTLKPLPPHAPLTQYYGHGPDAERSRYVVDLFNKTARHYNTIEMLLLNGGLWYRRFCLRRAGLGPGMKVLDVAIGTAAVARGAVQLVGPEGRVYGVDPTPGMLDEAKKVFHGPLTRGVAEHLPFTDGHFDFVTMGIALRHVSDLVATFREYRRVLKPGGTMWILEGYTPESGFGRSLNRFMMGKVIPGMTLLFTRSRDAKLLMDFYWDTVEQSVPPEQILQTLTDVGFEKLQHRVVSPVCEYIAKRPANPA
ncbi:MAG: class I SAM-dependent methyltransferase [Proteobacteria bacterium]|nr:class I SAM-dependent methyltransferase [Pseudomonadota bacterium]